MENRLKDIAERALELKSELLHGGYTGEFLEMHITDQVFTELLESIVITNKLELKKAIIHSYFLGQTI